MAGKVEDVEGRVRTGRRSPKEMDSPRNQILSLLVNKDEKELIDEMSEAMKLTRSAMLSRIVLTFASGMRTAKLKKQAAAQLMELLDEAFAHFQRN